MYIYTYIRPNSFCWYYIQPKIIQPSLILLLETRDQLYSHQEEAVSDEEATETETEDEAEVSWIHQPRWQATILSGNVSEEKCSQRGREPKKNHKKPY